MLTTLRRCRVVHIASLLQHAPTSANYRTLVVPQWSCLCRHRQEFYKNARTHSTQSDQHRQKVVIETTEPKIVIEDEKVLPDTKILDEKTISDLWKRKVLPYVHLARWDRPIGVYLLYWPCSWSIALGTIPGVPLETSLRMAGLFLLGAGLMRGAGCTINDMWDKDIDRQVERTKTRPLASGALSDRQALAFLGLQLSLALGVLLQLNCSTVLLGASSMLMVVTYPLAKRYTRYPQLVLGATFSYGALVGHSAMQGSVALACVPLYLAALTWTTLYDTIYAHQDKEDDARIGIKSTALTFGDNTKPALSGILATSASLFATSGYLAGLDWPYYAAVAAYIAHAGNQIYTLDINNPEDCAKKFKSNSMVGLIILLGIIGGGYRQYMENMEKKRGKVDISATKSCVFS